MIWYSNSNIAFSIVQQQLCSATICPRVILGWCRKQFKCKSKALMAKASISLSTATNPNEESLCNFPPSNIISGLEILHQATFVAIRDGSKQIWNLVFQKSNWSNNYIFEKSSLPWLLTFEIKEIPFLWTKNLTFCFQYYSLAKKSVFLKNMLPFWWLAPNSIKVVPTKWNNNKISISY